jgi:hypothetical protein
MKGDSMLPGLVKKRRNGRFSGSTGDSPLFKLGSISTTSPPPSSLGWPCPIARLQLAACQVANRTRMEESRGKPPRGSSCRLGFTRREQRGLALAHHGRTPPQLQMSLLLLEQAGAGGDRSCHSVWGGNADGSAVLDCGSRWGRSSVPHGSLPPRQSWLGSREAHLSTGWGHVFGQAWGRWPKAPEVEAHVGQS